MRRKPQTMKMYASQGTSWTCSLKAWLEILAAWNAVITGRRHPIHHERWRHRLYVDTTVLASSPTDNPSGTGGASRMASPRGWSQLATRQETEWLHAMTCDSRFANILTTIMYVGNSTLFHVWVHDINKIAASSHQISIYQIVPSKLPGCPSMTRTRARDLLVKTEAC
mgnify:CR=1 FL=1